MTNHASTSGRRGESGFTIAELLMTIIILTVTSSVVVVGALHFGSNNACTSDARMLRNAEANFFVANGRYGTQAELVAQRLIPRASTLHDINPTGLSYTVSELGSCIGTGTGDADTTPVVLPTTAPGLTVLVTNTTGSPTQGVLVQYRSGAGAWVTLGTTDAKGQANGAVAAGTYDVRGTLNDATSTVSSVQVGVGTLVYISTVPLTSQILTWGGAQITGVPMSAQWAAGGNWFSFGPTGASGAEVDVLPGIYNLQTTYNNVTATQSSQSAIGPTTVTFSTAPLTIQVVTKYGNGVPGVTVTLTPQGQAALASQVTDNTGKIVTDLLPYTYDVVGVFQLQAGAQTHTVTLDSVPTGTDPEVAVLTANR